VAFVVVPLGAPFASSNVGAVFASAAIIWLSVVPVVVRQSRHSGSNGHGFPIDVCPGTLLHCVRETEPWSFPGHCIASKTFAECIPDKFHLIPAGDGHQVATDILTCTLGLEPSLLLQEQAIAMLIRDAWARVWHIEVLVLSCLWRKWSTRAPVGPACIHVTPRATFIDTSSDL
jgi:hypothetical protein